MALAGKLRNIATLVEAGIVRPDRPDRLLRAGLALRRFGATPAAGYAAAAARRPDRVAVVDERGELTFAEVHRRTNALAHALGDHGVNEGDGVAIMCRNHGGFVEATVACSKLGAHALYLNTSFAAPQLADVLAREAPSAVIYDEEFTGLLGAGASRLRGFVAWADGATDHPTLEELIDAGDPAGVVAPSAPGRSVILTSGTTGAPKGANRAQPESLDPVAALLSRIPLRAGEPTLIAAPMFHAWGLAHFALGVALQSTFVLRRTFDPAATLAAIARHRPTALIVVPVMLQRIMELEPAVRERHDTSSLRVIAASGSALTGALAATVMDAFGEVLYNLYGSTEVSWATIADPRDLREAPGTAGRAPRGTTVRLYDDRARPVATGERGRIFVGNELLFDGYTGGGGKEVLDGLMSTGDVGRLDAAGRLFVEGRDDDMIVSGGENVFPEEIEALLGAHPGVAEAAVVGVPDAAFGQRLRAFVVARAGAAVDEAALKEHVRANLARYKVPREIVFLDELPRTATGKLLRRELR